MQRIDNQINIHKYLNAWDYWKHWSSRSSRRTGCFDGALRKPIMESRSWRMGL